MKRIAGLLIIIFSLALVLGCTDRKVKNKELQQLPDTISVPDTGFTGIKQFMSGKYLVSEVTLKNGVREGLMKSFYASGRLRQTFWYENGLRVDSSKWFYEEGQLFRSTPYKNDTVEGIQKQYYRNGRLKAELEYIKGLRTPYLKEFTPEGKLVGGYPELVVSIRDEYQSKGLYRISLSLSNKSTKVRYYLGNLSEGVFDTAKCQPVKVVSGVGTINLKKTTSKKTENIEVIASVLTNFGNNNLVYKKIPLPYTDLN